MIVMGIVANQVRKYRTSRSKELARSLSINRIQGRTALIPVISQKSTNAGYKSLPYPRHAYSLVQAIEHRFDITMSSYKPMRPEGDAALVETLLDLFLRRLENAGAGNDHLEFAIHAADTGQHAFAHFADEFDGHPARLAFRGDAVFGETGRA